MVVDPGQGSAAEAFEALRSEVALLHRAIEELAPERIATSDYGPTLADVVGRHANVTDVLFPRLCR